MEPLPVGGRECAEQTCACLQIHTTIQQSTLAVTLFPVPVDGNKLLEALAQKRSEPSTHDLMGSSRVDDLQHSANWETVRTYISELGPNCLHVHSQFLQRLD